MSFDLFVLCPSFDQAAVDRFNACRRPGLPAGLVLELQRGADGRTFGTISQDGDEWADLYVEPIAAGNHGNRPAGVGDDWIEVHLPSRGDPEIFHVVAALADACAGWVFDPQGAATEVALPVGDGQARHVESGYYTPAIARELAELLATAYPPQ